MGQIRIALTLVKKAQDGLLLLKYVAEIGGQENTVPTFAEQEQEVLFLRMCKGENQNQNQNHNLARL